MPSQKLLAARKKVFDSITPNKNKIVPEPNETDTLIDSKTLEENFEELKSNYQSLKEKMKLVTNMRKSKGD